LRQNLAASPRRGRYMLRQNIRVLERRPPHGA
jgi:hypothetical protein